MPSSSKLVENNMDIVADELYLEINRLFNEGRNIPDIIGKFLKEHNQSINDIFNWLSNQSKPKYSYILGLLYYSRIGDIGTKNAKGYYYYIRYFGTKSVKGDMYKLFLNAANNGIIMANIFLGKCREEGRDVKKDVAKAKEFYITASNCAAAEYALGNYYYKRLKYRKAFIWLKRSAENNNRKALYLLGIFYQKAFGTNFDNNKAFESFYRAAFMGLQNSQHELAKCYEYGEGTEKNLENAFFWYQAAMDNKHNCHNDLERVKHKLRHQDIIEEQELS
ncbi:3174_t:CDS:1 [Dentiscutata erythropus]|uniref:3174_t:CDS:1 n=1 Tax=Dentiscutata erythropus TaxID=1348616 RepID=A0A9N9NV36_9GLOM|nr:3174_t:CDS:1 [Dentiscutata erythropus]